MGNLSTTDADSTGQNNDLANLLNPTLIPSQLNSLVDKHGGAATADEDGDPTCQFCGISSPEFHSADKMDLHYVLQC